MLGGHKTSVSLEEAFWSAFKEIAARENLSPSRLVSRIDAARDGANLSSAIRVFVLEDYSRRIADPMSPSSDALSHRGEEGTSAH
jgi:predicted DNA-binding ribbon-helix-helix protein